MNDEAALYREHVAHGSTMHAPLRVEAANQLDAVSRLVEEKLPRNFGAARLACPSGQAWQVDGLGERGEREASGHGPSGFG